MHVRIYGIVEYVLLEDLIWPGQTTQYSVFPASKAEGKGKESLAVKNRETELKV